MRLVVLERPELLEGAYQQEEFDLDFDDNMPVIRVGRQLTNDITLLDFSVSRQHVELKPKSGGILVHDLNSSNGTFINEKPLSARGEALLLPGDKLRLGKALLRLETARKTRFTQSLDLLENVAERPKSVPSVQPKIDTFFMPPLPVQTKAEEVVIPPPNNQFQDASALPPPEQVEQLIKQRRQPPAKPRRSRGMWLVTFLVILLLVASIVLIAASLWVFNSSTPSSPTVVPLPTAAFSGATRAEPVLGLAITVPENWRRIDAETSKVVFNFPDSNLAAFTVEKPPSSSIPQATISPEEAIRQYLANVRRVGQNVRVLINPAATFLKDGTKAYSMRVVFSTNTEPIVKDYIVYAVSFKCDESLYFVTIGDEDVAFRDTHKQNLEAVLNSVGCK
jgi:FHA domain